jgi:acetolactate synthase-1/2/3 large subunit
MAEGGTDDTAARLRSGAEILVDQLLIHRAELIFGVPGESFLAVLDALVDAREQLRFIACRHEAGAANMADAYGKLIGRPGLCMVTRGPGASHAAVGLHTAFQDSTPMILFIGQVARGMSEREAFQEIDYRRMFGQCSKWVAEVDDARRIPEFIARAFTVATSGRPGPVVLALPEDMLTDQCLAADARPYRSNHVHPDSGAMTSLREHLAAAKRPIVIAGGAGWTAAAGTSLMAFAEANRLPVAAAFRWQDSVDNTHPNYVGDVGFGVSPKLAQRIRESDLVIAVGPRLGEVTTAGYTLLEVPVPRQALVHVHPSAEELGRTYQPALAIVASMEPACRALAALPQVDASAWCAQTEAAREDYVAHIQPIPAAGPVNIGEIVTHLRNVLPDDAIVTNGAGNYTVWVHRFFQHRRWRTQLAPTSGAMGYGVPAAVAAKLVHPDRTVVSFNGDGCFLMCGQEIATAVQYGLDPIFIVINNGMYGTIRMHQERRYPGRVSGTDLVNPDFAAYARAFGAIGFVVERTQDFPAAFAEAREARRPALIEIRVDPEALTPAASLSAIRTHALKTLASRALAGSSA